MCLLVNTNIHRNGEWPHGPIPQLASHNILVWKKLCFDRSDRTYLSPYRFHEWKMGEMQSLEKIAADDIVQVEVHKGFHAYTHQNAMCSNFFGETLHPAIIPKGSMIYFGIHGDIVSNLLVVYANLEQLKQFYDVDNVQRLPLNKLGK